MTQQMLGHGSRNDLTFHFQAAADDQRFPDGIDEPIGCVYDLHLNLHASSCRAHPGSSPPHLCRSHLSIICYNTDVSIVSYDE